MFKHFSDHASKVMMMANEEALRFDNEHIGTEHILLGLLREGSGVGITALKQLGADSERLTREIARRIEPGQTTVAAGHLPVTPRTKTVIGYAIEEAGNMNQSYVGTEHLLLALLREDGGIAYEVLSEAGLAESVRPEILKVISEREESEPGPPQAIGDEPLHDFINKFDPSLQQLRVERAEAVRNGDNEAVKRIQLLESRELELKTEAIRHILELDLSVSEASATIGGVILALIDANPALADSLQSVMPDIRKACKDA